MSRPAHSVTLAQLGYFVAVVCVGSLGYRACQIIDLAIGAFAGESGELRVETRQADFAEPSAGLDRGRVDVAFVRPPISARGPETEVLSSESRPAPARAIAHASAGAREAVEPAPLAGAA